MVVTVEPGIYFSVYALQHFYLTSPIHSKFINVSVLQRYLPVGGVRIEDDILITARGYENLSTAPKGDAMLAIIRQGKSGAKTLGQRQASPRQQSNEAEAPRLRAPGIPKEMTRPWLRPVARAATLPAELQKQDDIDFEPFAGPSLFSNFARSMTTEEKIEQWRRSHDARPVASAPPANVKKLQTICGNSSSSVRHIYMSNASSLSSLPRTNPEPVGSLMCKNCIILVQTLGRLRQTLASPTQSSPAPAPAPGTTTEGCSQSCGMERGDAKGSATQKNNVSAGASASTLKHGEMHMRAARPQPHPNVSSNQAKQQPVTQCELSGSPRLSYTHASHGQPASASSHNGSATERKSGPPAMASPPSRPSVRPAGAMSEEEVLRKKMEALHLRLSAMEERERSNTQGPKPRRPLTRPSMPDLI